MKRINKIISSVLASAISMTLCPPALAADGQTAENESKELLPYQNQDLTFEERAADLVSRMTLTEKAAQTGNGAPAISRLGVSKYNYWKEGIHGVARQGVATSFPSSLAMSNTWDRQLMYEVMDITSTEARGKNNKTDLSYWNPTINMARDPRWGRNEESYGEDPYLTAELGSQAVKGMQGSDDKYLKTISTLKHFAANNVEGERQRGTSIMTDKTLREYYTKAFKDIIESADPASVMSSYNAETISRNGETIIDYIASSANKYMLTDLLRRSWGFSGYVVGDCGAFANLFDQPSLRKNLFPDMKYEDITPEMTISKAFNAGGDLDCGHGAQPNVQSSVEKGYMSEDTLDAALYRLFLARMRTGEFDGDNIIYRDITKDVIEKDEHVKKAEEAAEKSWVLLENKNNVLPIKNDVTKVAVVGSFADKLVLGDYSGEPTKNTTPIEGITSELKKLNPDVEVNYLGNVTDDTKLFNVKSISLVLKDGSKRSVDLSKAKDITGMTVTGGTFTDVTPIAEAVIENVNFKDVVSVEIEMSTGGRIGGTLNISYGAGGPAVASVNTTATADTDTYVVCTAPYTGEDGGYNDTADMVISVSAKAEEFSVEAYKSQLDAADYIIAYAATIPKQAGLGSQDASESHDRASIALPEHESHVQAIADAGDYADKTIVAMSTVGQIDVNPFKDKCAAILWTSYNGQTQGEALGKVLTGAVNPSGRLSTTWYAPSDLEIMKLGSERIKDNTIGAQYWYTSYEIAQGENYPGRTYQYYSGDAVYPFGYGKSYTDFTISNITADKTDVDANGTVTITADVENTGSLSGTAIPQLYITVPGADGRTLPLKQLKGFERVDLNAGEKKTVTFALDIADVNFYDEATMKNYIVNGEYTAKVSENADDAGVSVKFNVTGTLSDKLKNITAVPSGIRLTGIKEGESVTPVNEIRANASAVLKNDFVIEDLTSNDLSVTYTSSNPSVASVSGDGTVTAGVSEGTAIITVTAVRNGVTKTDTFPVVTQLKDKITDTKKEELLNELENAYKSCYAPSYSEENYAKITSAYERCKEIIENSIVSEECESALAAALKEIEAVPVNVMKIKNQKDGKITVNVPYDNAVLIEARYENKILKSVKTNAVTQQGDITLEGYKEDGEVTLLLWNSLDGMKPLLPAVKHTYNAPVPMNEILFDFGTEDFNSFYETQDGQALTSGTGMDGFGGWQTDTHKRTIEYNDKTYTFNKGLKGGGGSETTKCVYFTPESDGMVTVFFNASTDRKAIVRQNGTEQEKFGDGNDLTTLEVNVTAGSPVYIYGGGSNKVIYGVLYRTAGSFTPPTPKPTDEPMPEIGKTDKLEVENYVKTWPEPEAKRITTSEVAGASNGKVVDNTKNGDIIYMGTRSIDNLAGIEVVAGTKEASAGVEFFAVDMTDKDCSSMPQSDVNELLTADNSIGKTSLEASGNWNGFKSVTARVKTDKSGIMGIFMKCLTGASYCGNFDYITLMYEAEAQTASYSADIVSWDGAEVVLRDNRVIELMGEGVEINITPETFAESDLPYNAEFKVNCMTAVEDQLHLGCDSGYLITMTPCAKCSTLKKVCDFDIKSLEYGENALTLKGEYESAVMDIADIRGYSITSEAAALMVKKGAVLVDVRSAEEFAEKSVEGSVNIPINEIERINELPKDKTLIFYCTGGGRAEKALQYAIDMGFEKIYNLGSIDKLI